MKIEFIDNYADYAAFEEDKPAETARILRKIADQVEEGRTSGTCHDYNGNKIGEWEV